MWPTSTTSLSAPSTLPSFTSLQPHWPLSCSFKSKAHFAPGPLHLLFSLPRTYFLVWSASSRTSFKSSISQVSEKYYLICSDVSHHILGENWELIQYWYLLQFYYCIITKFFCTQVDYADDFMWFVLLCQARCLIIIRVSDRSMREWMSDTSS